MNDNYFERFYSCYPRKKERGKARKAFDRIFNNTKEEEREALIMQIVLAIDAQKRERKKMLMLQSQGKMGTKIIPDWKHPTTWLNGQCWLDQFDDEDENFVAKPVYHYKEPCSQCKESGVVKVNEKWYCAWHYSKEFCNEGPTGLNRLREAYRTRVPNKPGESPYEYFIRVCGSKQIKTSLDSRDNRQGERTLSECEGN